MSVDPAEVHTLPELVAALNVLRGARSYTDLQKTARELPAREGRRPALPRSTVSDLLHGKSVPTRDTLITFLAACGLDEPARQPWLAAWERVSTAHQRRPSGAVRMREARPRLLGVHASIQVDPAATDLPVYVPRDLDPELRTAISAAAAQGGFVLLVGGSSVGKTRALFEALRAALPEWWLVHPDPADPDVTRAVAAAATPRTVVWLDELQRYLAPGGCLSAARARSLIAAGAVLAATLWPHEYTGRIAPRIPGQPDPHADDRELLGLARVIDMLEAFSASERRRAETLAADRRIRIALDTPDAGITQVLAAGPELVRWWENAPPEQCYGRAVITAALDARRVGAHAPLSRELLAAAAPAYLVSAQQAAAPADWLDQALAYATTPLHGATATLGRVAASMGCTTGYIVADYLYQHACCVRRTTPLPDAAWQTIVDQHHPDDTLRLGDNAQRRLRPHHAEALYRHAADTGDRSAVDRLVAMLAGRGHLGEALAILRTRADVGDEYAANRLADLLAVNGRLDELRTRADAGDEYAANGLADLLAERGHLGEALAILRTRAGAGNQSAVARLVHLLVMHDHLEELRTLADAGDASAANGLADVLAGQGHLDKALTILRTRADVGDASAAYRLAYLLAAHGHLDELRARADAGDASAANWLGALLAAHGHRDEALTILRPRADAGDEGAAIWLAYLLAAHGHLDELRARADAGDASAANGLADLLAAHGHLDELRARADAGDWYAANGLVNLLADQSRIDELEAEVHAGTPGAAEHFLRCDASRSNGS